MWLIGAPTPRLNVIRGWWRDRSLLVYLSGPVLVAIDAVLGALYARGVWAGLAWEAGVLIAVSYGVAAVVWTDR